MLRRSSRGWGAVEVAKQIGKRAVVVIVVVLAGTAGGALAFRAWQESALRRQLADGDPRVAQLTAYEIAEEAGPAFLDDVIELLERSDHDDVRESAGYAIHRLVLDNKLSDDRGRAALKAAVERQDDDIIRAKLIVYWARISGDDIDGTLREWAAGPQVWRSAGAAVALLERGDATAADVLFAQATCDEALRREYCANELAKVAAPMAEMVGVDLDLTTDGANGLRAEQLAALRAWWAGPRTEQVLNDHLDWHRENNPKWRLIKRMLHARERAEGWVGLKQ